MTYINLLGNMKLHQHILIFLIYFVYRFTKFTNLGKVGEGHGILGFGYNRKNGIIDLDLHKCTAEQGFALDVSENSGTPESSILIVFSIINHLFWGTPIFGNIHSND